MAVLLDEGLVTGAVLEQRVLQVVSVAVLEQAVLRRLLPYVQHVEGDAAPSQCVHRRDLVGLASDLELAQRQAAALAVRHAGRSVAGEELAMDRVASKVPQCDRRSKLMKTT